MGTSRRPSDAEGFLLPQPDLAKTKTGSAAANTVELHSHSYAIWTSDTY